MLRTNSKKAAENIRAYIVDKFTPEDYTDNPPQEWPEIAATVDGLKDQLKQIMQAQGVDTLTGTEHKATYKAVTSSRIDTSALKKDMPAVAAQYSRTTETRRFTFS